MDMKAKEYYPMAIWEFFDNKKLSIKINDFLECERFINKYLFLFGIKFEHQGHVFLLKDYNSSHVKKGLKNIKIILEKTLTSKQKII